MLEELYSDCLLPPDQNLEGCDITVKIEAKGIGKTQSKLLVWLIAEFRGEEDDVGRGSRPGERAKRTN